MTTFEVSGTPVPKARPRAFKTKNGNIRAYTPTNSKNFEHLVRMHAEKVFMEPIKGPVKLDVVFLMPRPGRMIWKTKPMPRVPCDKRPDATNLIKGIEDSLNGVAYLDDGQIYRIDVQKLYHAGNEGPKTIITVKPYDKSL